MTSRNGLTVSFCRSSTMPPGIVGGAQHADSGSTPGCATTVIMRARLPGLEGTCAVLGTGAVWDTWVYPGHVRHATAAALDELEPLLNRLRQLDGLTEKKRGVFYRNGKAFLHFHEDPSGLHADVRLEIDFERFRVQTSDEQSELIERVGGLLA